MLEQGALLGVSITGFAAIFVAFGLEGQHGAGVRAAWPYLAMGVGLGTVVWLVLTKTPP